MERRKFLRGVATGGAALTLAACATSAPELAPGHACGLPKLWWVMATCWPTSLDTFFGGAQTFAAAVDKGRITAQAGL